MVSFSGAIVSGPVGIEVLPSPASGFGVPQVLATPAPPHVAGGRQLPHWSTPPQPSPCGPQLTPSFLHVVGLHVCVEPESRCTRTCVASAPLRVASSGWPPVACAAIVVGACAGEAAAARREPRDADGEAEKQQTMRDEATGHGCLTSRIYHAMRAGAPVGSRREAHRAPACVPSVRHAARGKSITNRPPPLGLEPISMLPWHASTTRRTTARPIPVPVARVV